MADSASTTSMVADIYVLLIEIAQVPLFGKQVVGEIYDIRA